MTFVLARLGVNQRALHHPATAQQKPRRSWGRRRGCMVEAGEASVGHGALHARPRLRVVQPNEITVPQAFVDNPLALVSRLTSDDSFFGHTTFSAHRPVGAPLFFWRQAEGRGEPLPPH
jgi:hypothetical protein